MVKVIKDKWGNYIKGTVTLEIEAYLDSEEDEISEERALKLLDDAKYELAGSNSGSEQLMNAKVKILNEL